MSQPKDDELDLNSDCDDLFLQRSWPKPFEFDENVVRVFDDMVSRSVPLYRDVLISAAQWALAYYQPNTRMIDVGCSTGTLLELVGRQLTNPAQLVGIDNAEAMRQKAHEKLSHLKQKHQIDLICAAAEDCFFENSSVVVMNYTLQFLPLKQRRQVLQSIFEGLVTGGLLFLSEKVISPFPQFQETMTQNYEAFKAKNGYARREIERKKEALENVLVPLTESQLRQMLKDCGFLAIDTLMKQHNFMTFVALKTKAHDAP